MRLSDAIALGRTLVNPKECGSTSQVAKPGDGCVLDMAVLAIRGIGNWQDATRIWKWLKINSDVGGDCRTYETIITSRFDWSVMTEKTWTLDQLIDWVRSVEPAEFETGACQSEPPATTEIVAANSR